MLRCLPLLLCGLAVAACDGTPSSGPLTFDGVEVAARGDATLAVSGGELVVSGLEDGREGGFSVAGVPVRLDVTTAPVELPAVGARFGVVVDDAAGEPLAALYNEAVVGATGVPTARLRLAFPDGTTAVRVTYRLGGDAVFVIPDLRLRPGDGRLAQEASAGETQNKAESVHVVRSSDGRWIVISDSQASDVRGGCAGYIIRPPVELPVEFPNGTLCADWVEVEPLDGPVRPAARMSVVGRGVGSFTVRTLEATF